MHKQTVKYWILLFSSLFLLAGCGEDSRKREITDTYCEDSTKNSRAEFILECIDKGNPKSDEEPEDWITLCQRMAEDTFCNNREFIVTERCNGAISCYWQEEKRELKVKEIQ